MDIVTYLNAAKQQEAYQRMWNTTNNIANGNTRGFVADRLATSRAFVDELHTKTSYPSNSITIPDLTASGIAQTKRSLDLALDGPGFFMVQTPTGIRYTKAGHFMRNNEGELVTPNNYTVLSSDGQSIVFDETDADPIIDYEGRIIVNGEERGIIGIAEFANTRLLQKSEEGNSLLKTTQLPQLPEKTTVMQGMLAESTVNTVSETTNLIYIQREAAMTKEVVDMINEMYRNANRAIASQGGQ